MLGRFDHFFTDQDSVDKPGHAVEKIVNLRDVPLPSFDVLEIRDLGIVGQETIAEIPCIRIAEEVPELFSIDQDPFGIRSRTIMRKRPVKGLVISSSIFES
jgi:hypothetical protein